MKRTALCHLALLSLTWWIVIAVIVSIGIVLTYLSREYIVGVSATVMVALLAMFIGFMATSQGTVTAVDDAVAEWTEARYGVKINSTAMSELNPSTATGGAHMKVTQHTPGAFVGYTRTLEGLMLAWTTFSETDGFIPTKELAVTHKQ